MGVVQSVSENAQSREEYFRAVEANRILQVLNLRKLYQKHCAQDAEDLLVLNDINFDVGEGEFVSLIGPSGCGKSTLLNIVAGLDSYDGGDVVVSGHRIQSAGPDIVMIFQEDALFPWLSVSGNVEFGLKEEGVAKEERARIAANYLDMVGLTKFANSRVHQLSGGMKQRVAIARALALNPRILLMDEPFGALDANTRENLHVHIQLIHEKTRKTIIFVTHDVREAVCLGDRVILLTHRPARIKQQYLVQLPRPRVAYDPALEVTIMAVMRGLKEETGFTKDEVGDQTE
jgi:NitT/TauT family transport system ATP-binding protein